MATHDLPKHPRLTMVLLGFLVLAGLANLALFGLTGQTMQLVLGLVLPLAGVVNLVRLRKAMTP